MLFVFVWLPKLKNQNIGHGSMQVNGEYISNWPGKLISVLYGPGAAAPDFDSDKSAEGGLPEVAFKLKGLDEKAIESKWANVKKAGLAYSFLTKNCFQTVAEMLSEGLSFTEGVIANTAMPPSMVLVHAALITYVHAISVASGQGIPKNLMSGKNIFQQAYDEALGN